MTQKEFGESINRTARSVQIWESGREPMPPELWELAVMKKAVENNEIFCDSVNVCTHKSASNAVDNGE